MSTAPQRILLATPYDLAVPGGVNRQPFALLSELERRGIEARLVGPCSYPGALSDPRVVSMGPPSRYLFNGALSRVTFDPRVLPRLRRLVADFDPDVVHVQEPVVPFPSAALLWLAPPRALRVATFHTFSETSRWYLWGWPWVRLVWSRLHVRCAVSKAAHEFATRYHEAEFELLPNGISLPENVPVLRSGPGPLRVLFVGRLDEPRKGFDVLRQAFELLHQRDPDRAKLTVVGRGAAPWKAKTSGLPVHFLGEVSDKQLAAAYVDADLVVVPSLGGESFGLVPLEAMAHGRPVLASRISGYSAWMDGPARLVPPGDATALATALEDLLDDRQGRVDLARRGLTAAKTFAWPELAERWLEVYSRR